MNKQSHKEIRIRRANIYY